MIETIAIIGVGLIGGSFGLALRKAGFGGHILGVSSPTVIQVARRRGAIDEAVSLEQAAARADLIYLAQPIRRILEILPRLDPLVRPQALITDAGSTKEMIVAEARRSIRTCQFLGGHPIAGKETRGVEEADGELFAQRPYVLTPLREDELKTQAAQWLLEWLGRIGAITIVLPPNQHDHLIAYTSHLPQLASTALALALAEEPESRVRMEVAGPALIDMTRLALSSFDIWGDILRTNAKPIERALSQYIRCLEGLRAGLAKHSLQQDFEIAAKFAGKLRRVNGL